MVQVDIPLHIDVYIYKRIYIYIHTYVLCFYHIYSSIVNFHSEGHETYCDYLTNFTNFHLPTHRYLMIPS